MWMTEIRRVPGPGGWRTLRAGAVALAAVGVLAVPPAVASASSQALDWTHQVPPRHPPGRCCGAMAYDAATSTAVLFGGVRDGSEFNDTWSWDGTTWTKQHPAASPPALSDASMAYDAATHKVVLFGGIETGVETLNQTWTWDGTTWRQQHPAISPSARYNAALAYDVATHTVVLFGGAGFVGTQGIVFGDTWTWDGTTWTQQHPAASPPGVAAASMAYDAASSTVVLFGGDGSRFRNLAGTWTWDGTTWTRQHPVAHPPGRAGASMAYDAATSTVVLFGGSGKKTVPDDPLSRFLGDTWTWDGTTWTQQHPAASPSPRNDAAMAYDAATGSAVLFGGHVRGFFSDTWTWG
jgi:hypothetical protein